MAIITKAHLRRYSDDVLLSYQANLSITEEHLRRYSDDKESSMFFSKTKHDSSSAESKKNIFLSHKHTDREDVLFLKNLLGMLGINLYVDWLDENMPAHTNPETAQRIKKKIKENDKFILLATNDAINSKWCNWELGFADNEKLQQDKLVLFPLKGDYNWSGSEYMQLYPVIEWEDGFSLNTLGHQIQEGHYVFYPGNNGGRKYKELKEWLLEK